jgi:hypothetical protein
MTQVFTDDVPSGLRELTDRDYQCRVCFLDHEFERCPSVFGDAIDRDLQEIHRLVREVGYDRPPDEVIDDPLMSEIRDRAAAVLRALEDRPLDPT